MEMEIERKFLLKNQSWKGLAPHAKPALIRQGYLNTSPERTIRVRLKNQQGYLTIKGKTAGISRLEFEYSIPLKDAESLLLMCEGPLIEKVRHFIYVADQLWEIDEFFGENEGLVLAEAELASEEQELLLPEWVGEEVSHDKRYYNSNLAFHPYSRWK